MDINLWDGVGRVGCEATEERSDAWGPHITFDEAQPIAPYIKRAFINTAMGECDRKPRLMVGGQLHLNDTAVRSTYGIEPYSS